MENRRRLWFKQIGLGIAGVGLANLESYASPLMSEDFFDNLENQNKVIYLRSNENHNLMKINLKCIYIFILITSLSFAQTANDNLFKTDEVAIVTKNDSINLDEYKGLILIPGGAQFRKYFETINYFDKFQTFEEFEKEIKKSEFKKEVGDFYGNEGLINAYTKYKKFLCLFITEDNDNTVNMSLYKPDTKEIFTVTGKSKTNYIGISAGTKQISEDTYESMLNELVKYIKSNSKTYKK